MTPAALRPYRVFISYSHDDRKRFDEVCAALRRVGAQPWSDADLAYGSDFPEQIQTNISHSHLFMPILTEQSNARGWVHQEIGFAVAMKVPCVPISEFDDRLAELLKDQGIAPAQSKGVAVKALHARIRQLPPHPAWAWNPPDSPAQ